MCNTQNSLLLNQHNGDDAPQDVSTRFLIHQYWHRQTLKLLAHHTRHKILCPCKLLYGLPTIPLPSQTKLLILNRSDLSTKCTVLTLNKWLKLHIPVIWSWSRFENTWDQELEEGRGEPFTLARRVSYRGTEAQPNPPLHQGNRQPPHKTKNEAQPPHKQKAET